MLFEGRHQGSAGLRWNKVFKRRMRINQQIVAQQDKEGAVDGMKRTLNCVAKAKRVFLHMNMDLNIGKRRQQGRIEVWAFVT